MYGEWFGLVLVGLLVVLQVRQNWFLYGRLPWFEDYCRLHPESIQHGRCHCHVCGSGRIYIYSLSPWRRRHICVQCGEVLYRS